MTYIPYLGTFFFSRYPSVALARNIIKRGKTELPCLEGVSPFSLCVLFSFCMFMLQVTLKLHMCYTSTLHRAPGGLLLDKPP